MSREVGWKIGACRENPPSSRDFNFEKVSDALRARGSIMTTEFVLPEGTPISDQGRTGSCVWNARCDGLEMLMPKPRQLSRLFGYWNSRRMDGEECKDDGTFIRRSGESLRKHGICLEELWPFEPDAIDPITGMLRLFSQPSLEAYEQAFDHRLGHSPLLGDAVFDYTIRSTGRARMDDIEIALRAGRPVIFGAPVGADYSAYFTSSREAKVFEPPLAELGGHAQLITGIASFGGEKHAIVRNSWGDGGWSMMPGHSIFHWRYIAICYDLTVQLLTVDFDG